MIITLRPASEEDQDFCRQVHHRAYHDVVERQFGRWDDAQQDGFFAEAWHQLQLNVIEADGHPIGCLCCETQPEQILLLEIFLLPALQGNGIGTKLIRQEQAAAAKQGLPLRLRVLKENRARQLYQRLGFQDTGEDATHYLMEWGGDHDTVIDVPTYLAHEELS